MDKKIWNGTTFTKNPKNFKDNVWKAKKLGFQFSIFRKSFKWRIEATNTKTGENRDFSELGFSELGDAFQFVTDFKN
jgi:hypothetical protein